jgi:hypothetical protein
LGSLGGFNHHCFAFLKRDSELSFAQKARIASEYVLTPAVESCHAVVLESGKFLDIVRVRDQTGSYARFLGA